MSGTAVQEALAALRRAHDALAGCDVEALTRTDLLAALGELEGLWCQLPTQRHRLLARLQVEATPRELGAKSWREVLTTRFRVSSTEANRWLSEAATLGPRRGLTGQPLAPALPATAAAQAAGLINGEHITVIGDALGRLPGFVDAPTRTQIEVDLVRTAVGVGPKELKDCARRMLFLLDQDGPEPDDAERARKRGLAVGKQGRDAMTPWRGELTPEAWAMWEAIFAKYAAPGMCNPDDDQPCTSGTPTQSQIDGDRRSLANAGTTPWSQWGASR